MITPEDRERAAELRALAKHCLADQIADASKLSGIVRELIQLNGWAFNEVESQREQIAELQTMLAKRVKKEE